MAAALAGCSAFDGGGNGGAKSDIRAVLKANARTIESENLEAHMDTLHPESPEYESTEAIMGQLLEQYDLSVDITIRSVSVSWDSAEADVEQTTRETSGAADYQDNRSQLLHELRTHEGEWKIYSSTMLDREFL